MLSSFPVVGRFSPNKVNVEGPGSVCLFLEYAEKSQGRVFPRTVCRISFLMSVESVERSLIVMLDGISKLMDVRIMKFDADVWRSA